MQEDNSNIKVTFFLKNDIECPVCGNIFKREELLTGRGRLIAQSISDELRRIYEPSKIYGTVNPLLYPITVCPKCLYACYHEDFNKLKPEGIQKAKQGYDKRKQIIDKIFPALDFNQLRILPHGAASYILAIECYDYFDKWVSPTIKKAISSIRAAWLLSDLETEDPLADFGDLENLFYKRALQYYLEVLQKQEKGQESFDGIKSLGPDTDYNYQYDGILYLVGALTLKTSYLQKNSPERVENLEKAKKIVSKMVGFGRVSKDKPSLIIEKARDLYDEIGKKIEEVKLIIESENQGASKQAPSTDSNPE